MTIILNGATIQLNKTQTSIVVRDKHGHFVGMKSLEDTIEELLESKATGELKILLYEVETPKATAQSTLDMKLADPDKLKLGVPQP